MAGTSAGGKKAAKTNKAKHGADFYARIGSKGGKLGHTGGFHKDDRTWWQKVLKHPSRAQRAGKIGGTVSKRRSHGKQTI